MSVRQGMLALLAEEPAHCYHLRQRFEERTGGTWPLNIGQAYSTVQRLVRDGLVEVVPQEEGEREAHVAPDDAPAQQVEQFRLTASGYDAVESWWASPVTRGTPGRDELAIKVALAVTSPGVDVRAIIQTQRTETMRALRDYTRLAGQQGSDLTWALVLDNLVFTTEAEVRWLDHVEARIARAASSGTETSTRETAGTTTAYAAASVPGDFSTAHAAGPQGGPAAGSSSTEERTGVSTGARAGEDEGAR